MSWSGRIVRRNLHGVVNRVRRLQRRDDAFGCVQRLETLQRLLVVHGDVLRALARLQPAVLRSDAGVIEAGRDAVRLEDLAVGILQQVGASAVQHARPAGDERRGVPAGCRRLRPPLRRRSAAPGHRGTGGTGRSRCCRRRRTRRDIRQLACLLEHLRARLACR